MKTMTDFRKTWYISSVGGHMYYQCGLSSPNAHSATDQLGNFARKFKFENRYQKPGFLWFLTFMPIFMVI